MNKDTIGLKISPKEMTAKALFVIRKYDNIALSELKKKVKDNEYILCYSYTDRFGLKKIIQCYEELSKIGVDAQLFELDDIATTINELKTLNNTYDEISDEIDNDEL